MLSDYETEINVLAGLLINERLLHEGLTVLTDNHFVYSETQAAMRSIRDLSTKFFPSLSDVYKRSRSEFEIETHTHLINAHSNITESSFSYWFQRLQDMFIRRSYLQAANEIKVLCESDQPISEITEIVEQKIMRVHAQEGTNKIIEPEAAGQNAADEFDRRFNSPEAIHGIKLSRPSLHNGEPSTDGFPGIDKVMKGLKGGDLLILAAETGEGKTTLAQNIVRHASIHQDHRTFYQNTEMDPNEMVFRFAAQMSGQDFDHVYDGGKMVTPLERTKIRQAFESFSKSRVYLSQLPELSPQSSRGLARQFKMKYGKLDLLVIDYVGRMEMENTKGKQEWQIMRDIAKQCKKLAQELDTACILIAQLTEEGKLQGAKAMANEADGMFFLIPLDESEVAEAPFKATHKLQSKKARRGDKNRPIWISFNKPKMYITEVMP